jgi:flagellin
VQGAKDNAAIWAIAQQQRADTSALSAVKQSLDRATSIADVALAAGESVSDLLNQLKEKVVAAKDTSLKTQSRQLLDADFKALLRAISSAVENATFDGGNILDGSLTNGLRFLANADATSFITLSAKNLSLSGAIISLGLADSLLTTTGATTALNKLDNSITALNRALGDIGAQAKQIQAHNTFVSKLTDTLESGIGNLVDADLAKESARLQALQVQQQLGAQALSIANQAPQIILSLFRN